MDDRSFKLILAFFDLSWTGYQRVRKGVKKRLSRHMRACACRNVTEYLALLAKDNAARKAAERLLTVSISRFFRDPEMWAALEGILESRFGDAAGPPAQRPFRAWSAGCACGEEVYSLKILWRRLSHRLPNLPPLDVWAGDVNPAVLERAQKGVYPRSAVRNLPVRALDESFIVTAGKFAVRPFLRTGIRWLRHDFMSAPPPGEGFDLIFLRNNLLTYFRPNRIIPGLSKIIGALARGGLLVVGMKESPPEGEMPIAPRRECRCIFERR